MQARSWVSLKDGLGTLDKEWTTLKHTNQKAVLPVSRRVWQPCPTDRKVGGSKMYIVRSSSALEQRRLRETKSTPVAFQPSSPFANLRSFLSDATGISGRFQMLWPAMQSWKCVPWPSQGAPGLFPKFGMFVY